ncbi:MAG: FtsX-like permease family protein [Deltaproteobacteria bacterium]|nr:FtsX-like permease family protein [Deltaproteobacteria bacterium]
MKNIFNSFPYQYHLRNLFARKASTLLNLFAVMVTVLVFLVMNGMAAGLKHSLQSTGREDILVLLTRGAQTAEVSKIPYDFFPVLKYYPQIAKRTDGSPKLSQEVYTLKPMLVDDSKNRRWIPMRGIDPASLDLYKNLLQLEGNALQNSHDLLVGNLARLKLGNVKIGDQIQIGRQKHKIVGFFSASGSAYESELWMSRNDLKVDFDMSYDSIAVVQFNSLKNRDDFIDAVSNDKRLRLDIKTEREYFSSLSENAGILEFIANLIAIVLSIAAVFTGMNALYASVAARSTEIGTLRSMGYGRQSIQLGFMFEGVSLSLLAGCAALLLSLFFQHLPIAFMRASFRIQIPFTLMIQGFGLSFMVGLIGSYIPARQAAKMKIVQALR